jgi:hypothetical protein
VRPEGLGKFKIFVYLIGSRTLNLPARSIVPQPLRYRVPLVKENFQTKSAQWVCLDSSSSSLKRLIIQDLCNMGSVQ